MTIESTIGDSRIWTCGFLRGKGKATGRGGKKQSLTEKRRGAEGPDQGICTLVREGYERFGKIVLQ